MKTGKKLTLEQIVAALNEKLRIDAFQDASHNGLQVGAPDARVTRVCCGVDASLSFFEAAAAQGADLLVCHHGLSWGDSLKRIAGLNYRQIEFLVEHKMALWACHLPLDAHTTLGNNAVILRLLGLRNRRPAGRYHGQVIGLSGELPRAMNRKAFADLLRRRLAPRLRVMPFGPERIRTVGIVSGGAADLIGDSDFSSLDAFVSGEPSLVGYNLACQLGVNAFFAGHYATERFGVQAVGRWLQRTFDLPVETIDLQVPY